jgi:tetratricopeptide (TPR) repeat protein
VAKLYTYTSQGVAAESLYRQANAIFNASEGRLAYHTVTTLEGQAYALDIADRYAAAESLYRDAVARVRQVYGDTSLQTANAYNDLGLALTHEGRMAAAEPLLKKVLAIRLAQLGNLHPDVQLIRVDLGRLCMNERRYAEAQRLFEQAWAARQPALGPAHPAVASSEEDLADLYQDEGRFAESARLYRRILPVWEKGDWKVEVLRTRRHLGEVLRDGEQLDSAETLLTLVVRDTRATYGDTSMQMGLALNDLGKLAGKKGRHHLADSLLRVSDRLCRGRC